MQGARSSQRRTEFIIKARSVEFAKGKLLSDEPLSYLYGIVAFETEPFRRISAVDRQFQETGRARNG